MYKRQDETDRMGKTTFEDLQEFKTQQSIQDTSVLKANLRELNIEIVKLENESTPYLKEKFKNS